MHDYINIKDKKLIVKDKAKNRNNDKVSSATITVKSKTPTKSTSNKKIKYYTIEEVKKHKKETDAWLIYKDKVYDVTKFIYKHPGALAILKGVGKDATSIFDKIGHSNRARNILRKYYIGNIRDAK